MTVVAADSAAPVVAAATVVLYLCSLLKVRETERAEDVESFVPFSRFHLQNPHELPDHLWRTPSTSSSNRRIFLNHRLSGDALGHLPLDLDALSARHLQHTPVHRVPLGVSE